MDCSSTSPDRARWAALVCLALLLGLWGGGPAGAQEAPPGSVQEFERQLERARLCFELIDYGCVIGALEGPLLVRRALPDGLHPEDIRRAYEMLALSYLAAGLDDDSARTFERLLELEPRYRLTRADVSPETIARVEALAARRQLALAAERVAAQIQRTAAERAAIMTTRGVAARLLAPGWGRRAARHIAGVARLRALRMRPPDWGPLEGPGVSVAAAFRGMTGADAAVWASGFGVAGGAALRYWPLSARLSAGWTRHDSLLEQPIITPAPALDVVNVDLWLGGVRAWLGATWGAEAGGGLEVLLVGGAVRTINPSVGVALSASRRLGVGVEAVARVRGGWVFGLDSARDDATTASFALLITLGVVYLPEW